jgi:hypothetical protein
MIRKGIANIEENEYLNLAATNNTASKLWKI